ncbi:MAG: hypothetical protein WAK28_02070 [Trebonia sp.]
MESVRGGGPPVYRISDETGGLICATSLYETCEELFIRYPLAARALDRHGTARLIVLMDRDGDDVSFFLLSRNGRDSGSPSYSLSPWSGGDVVDIAADGPPGPRTVANAVIRGVPLPRHGSLFGWMGKDSILALVGCDTESGTAGTPPSWSVMPLVGSPESEWPPFTNESFFGNWFWEFYQAGDLVSLDSFIFAVPNTAFWVSTQAIIGSDCCVVARDIEGPARHPLRRGRYVDSEVLQAGISVPSLPALLADVTKVDLAPRFRSYVQDDADREYR